MIENVALIGAGNLATQLAIALKKKDIKIKQVFSRNKNSAKELAEKTGSAYTNNLSELVPDADIYIIAVKDSAILEVLENLQLNETKLIVHTAGSVPMSILEGFSNNYGVFYPLQTFSKSREVDFSNIPICIEANHPSVLMKLENLAKNLTISVNQINSDERKTLHLAAVFANNFVNQMYTVSAEILQNKKLDFELLKPLIAETAAKVQELSPIEAQTGPAKRYDQTIINAHLNMLDSQPDYRKIYSFVTESIFQLQQKHSHDIL